MGTSQEITDTIFKNLHLQILRLLEPLPGNVDIIFDGSL